MSDIGEAMAAFRRMLEAERDDILAGFANADEQSAHPNGRIEESRRQLIARAISLDEMITLYRLVSSIGLPRFFRMLMDNETRMVRLRNDLEDIDRGLRTGATKEVEAAHRAVRLIGAFLRTDTYGRDREVMPPALPEGWQDGSGRSRLRAYRSARGVSLALKRLDHSLGNISNGIHIPIYAPGGRSQQTTDESQFQGRVAGLVHVLAEDAGSREVIYKIAKSKIGSSRPSSSLLDAELVLFSAEKYAKHRGWLWTPSTPENWHDNLILRWRCKGSAAEKRGRGRKGRALVLDEMRDGRIELPEDEWQTMPLARWYACETVRDADNAKANGTLVGCWCRGRSKHWWSLNPK